MKLKIDIDCTPQEARAFLGLPDVESIQRAVLERVEQRTLAYFDSLDPENLAGMWMPAGLEGWQAMQKAFTQFTNAATGRRPDAD